MTRMKRPRGYQGGYLIGFVLIGVVMLRVILFYRAYPDLAVAAILIALYALLYSSEPWLSERFGGYSHFYFPSQTALVITLSNLRPFLDFHTLLYFPLLIQVFRAYSRPAAMGWSVFFVVLLAIALLPGLGFWTGLAFILQMLASGAFLISYDFLYLRTQAAEAESQRLLTNLQSAHLQLQEQAAQTAELAAARERNRLARELHDSVSQVIFSITLTSQSARLLLERNPARAAGEIQRLQGMTSEALSQLRSLIAALHPH
jgi:signal transduction histidine kinase